MKSFLIKIPYPIAGVMLALVALGNLMGTELSTIRILCGLLSGVLAILLLLKVLMMPKSLIDTFLIPSIGATLMTYPMGIMLLSTYLKPFNNILALCLWIIGVLLAIMLQVVYTVKHTFPIKQAKVYASYFVLYIGIVVISVTAPAFGFITFGKFIFWYGLLVYILILPLVCYRYFVVKGFKDPEKPLVMIFAAPANLLVVGYLKSFEAKAFWLITILIFVGLIWFVYSLIKAIGFYQTPFYPSFAAFTFPFVISAIAMKGYVSYLTVLRDKGINPILLIDIDSYRSFVNGLATFESIWAVFIVTTILGVFIKKGQYFKA